MNMKKWQKYWLYFLIAYSTLHIIRDLLQDFGINNFLSTLLVKKTNSSATDLVFWNPKITYFIAVTEIFLSIYCLKTKGFGKVGLITIIIAFFTIILWLVYWFFL